MLYFQSLTGSFLDWSRQRAMDRPTLFGNALMHGAVGQSGVMGQILQRSGYAVVCMQHLAALIDALCFGRRPSAILRRIAERVVDAVNRVFRCGAWSHIRQEMLKGVQPACANGDASRAVPRKIFASDACASIDHVRPHAILRALRHAMRRFRGEHFTFDAATGTRAGKIVQLNRFFCSAVASHLNEGMCAVGPKAENRQPSIFRAEGWSGHAHSLPYFGFAMGEIACH